MTTSSAGPDSGDPKIVFHELSAMASDIALLERFYNELYLAEFPDPDERESLDNMVRYLELKAQGWYGANNYHIVLLLDAGRPVAGSVSDYLSGADAGVIEFLLVAPQARRHGLDTRLLHWTETTLTVDASSRSTRALCCIVAEMHDPRYPDRRGDGFDPHARALIWNNWGYRRLDFDYIQPALSDTQQAARYLMLLAKSVNGAQRHDTFNTHVLQAVLHEYLVWAMRIEHPEQCAEFQEMCARLAGRSYVDLITLDDYVRRNSYSERQ